MYTIMIVDDDDEFRGELREFLEGHTVIEAASGEQALRVLRRPHEIDLVVLDEVLPGMPGTAVLRAIRQIAPELGVIMLTGNATKDVAVSALQGRADDFIEKPPDPALLQRMIAAQLARRPGRAAVGEAGTAAKVAHVQRLLRRNVDKKATLAELSAAVCLSPKYLSRAFAEVTGRRFGDYKASLKIERARQLLGKTDHTVAWIAEHLGYQNPESFIRQFKRIAKTTPSRYRAGRRRRRSRP